MKEISSGYATKQVSDILGNHGALPRHRRTVFQAYFEVVQKKIPLKDFPGRIQKLLPELTVQYATGLAGEICNQLFRGYELYFDVPDILEYVDQWLPGRKAVAWSFAQEKQNSGSLAAEAIETTPVETQKNPQLLVSPQKLTETAVKIFESLGLSGLSSDQRRRAQDIFLTQLKDIRDVTEAAIQYELPLTRGGVGLPREQAGKLAGYIDDLIRKKKLSLVDISVSNGISPLPDKGGVGGEFKTKEGATADILDPWDHYASTRPTMPTAAKVKNENQRRVASALSRPIEGISTAKAPDRQAQIADTHRQADRLHQLLGKQVVNLKPPTEKRLPVPPRAEPPTADGMKAVGASAKNEKSRKLIGEISDWERLTPSLIRYAGGFTKNHDVLIGSIRDIIATGIAPAKIKEKWQQSPLYETYLEMGRQSVFSGKALDQLAKMLQGNNQAYLTAEEFAIVADLSRFIDNAGK